MTVRSELSVRVRPAVLLMVLFSDASRIDLRQLRPDVGVPLRLLGIGLPLTIGLGALAAAVIFDQLTLGEALILGVILAPTDAALGPAVVTEPRVPARIRQGLNVESGLNDGICVPLLFAAVAAADVESEISEGRSPGELLLEEIGYGVVGGVAAGLLVAAIFVYAGGRGLIEGAWRQVIPAYARCHRRSVLPKGGYRFSPRCAGQVRGVTPLRAVACASRQESVPSVNSDLAGPGVPGPAAGRSARFRPIGLRAGPRPQEVPGGCHVREKRAAAAARADLPDSRSFA